MLDTVTGEQQPDIKRFIRASLASGNGRGGTLQLKSAFPTNMQGMVIVKRLKK